MRILVLCFPLLLGGAFLIGRATSPEAASGASATHIYTGRNDDVFRAPGAAIRCEVGLEARSPKVSCTHTPAARAHYAVVFYRDNWFVYRLGDPDNPVWSARGKP